MADLGAGVGATPRGAPTHGGLPVYATSRPSWSEIYGVPLRIP